ncbi:PQQ-dependent sugar dehydrogenase [Methylobacterium oryzae CBMB20]|uniref:L-sorbosone dehydrogenase n=1 Tax=Methylobacterium oryzae TaxID=334852 RepID=A0ABU7TY47_9HYPH
MMRRTPFLTAGLLLPLAACGPDPIDPQTQVGPNPPLPALHQYLLPPMHVSGAIGWKDGETPEVAPGLQVKALATDLKNPRSLLVLPNGDVLVAESGGPTPPINRPKEIIMGWLERKSHSAETPGQRITLLRDADGDGVAEQRTVLLDKQNAPFGMVLIGGDLYVAETDAVVRYPYKAGDTAITEPGVKLADLPAGRINHHWTKSLTASPDGSKLYVGVGSNSNITENGLDEEKDRAAIWEIDRATGAHRLYATGLRNPNGLTFEPQTRTLWCVVNERDELGPDLVPDYMTSVKDGGFYGWPYSYWGDHVDPRVMPQRPDRVAAALMPDYSLSSHVAPLGMTFSSGAGLPQAYRGGAFVGEHGSWNRQPLNGYKVVYIPFENGRPSGKARDVVTGFLTEDGHARGRPVGMAMDGQGALLIADDAGSAVWRVTGTASQTRAGPSPIIR